MVRGTWLGLVASCLMLGASGCGQPGPTVAAATPPSQAPSGYSVQVDDMMPGAPSVGTAPTGGTRPRYRPRGSTIYLRGVPIIRETYPIPDRRRDTILLRGTPIIPGTFNAPYPRPDVEIRQQRQLDFARVRLTEVENRIRQLEGMLGYTSAPSMRDRISSELQQQRGYQETLQGILRGGSQ